MKEMLHMRKIILVLLWTVVTIAGTCAFACWARSDMPDYPQNRHYIYEGDDYRIRSLGEMDEAMLDEINQSITIRDEEQIEIGQMFLPEPQLPEDVPEEYQFESLTITKYLSGRWEYAFVYKDTLEMLCVLQRQGENLLQTRKKEE